MNFLFPTIEVEDLDKSMTFYMDIIKLEEERLFKPREGVEIAFLRDVDGNLVELIENRHIKENLDDRSSKVQLGFEVDNLEETIKFLNENGIHLESGPVDISEGRFITVRDPDGVRIALFDMEE